MKLRDLRVGWRILAKDPVYSLVSILGLAVGLSVFLLLVAYARYCWQYNAFVPDTDNVYIVKQRDNLQLGTPWYDQAPLFLVQSAKTIPGVTNATAYLSWLPLTVQVDGQLRNLESLTVLPGFGEILGLDVIKGDLNDALTKPDAFAITDKAAKRLFGTADVLGRTVELRLSAVDENRSVARIAAIVRALPTNTTIPFETLNGPNLSLIPTPLHNELFGSSDWMGFLLIRTNATASTAAVTEALQKAFDTAPGTRELPPEATRVLGNRHVRDIKLARLRDAYFDREIATTWLSLPVERGDADIVAGLLGVAFLIVALAAVNYINLATIRVVRRQREIAMRKVLGVSNARLALQFVVESLLVAGFASVIGLCLACVALPVFSQVINRDMGHMLSLENVGIALILGLALGITTAVYPAWIALGVRPSLMLMGRPDSESLGSKRLRKVLSLVQVSAAMGLASFTLAIFWQARFAINSSPGFDSSPLLVFELPKGAAAGEEKPRGLIAALTQRPEVAGVAVSLDAVGRSQESSSTEIKREGHEAMTIDVKSVSANFFQLYNIRPVIGRLFDPSIDKESGSGSIVLNALAAHQLGFESLEQALGQTVLFKKIGEDHPVTITQRIVGIAPEIRFHSLREAPVAVAYEVSDGSSTTVLTVRASRATGATERAVREVWSQYYPNSVLEIKPAKDIFAANYADDERLGRLLQISTLVAMIIAAFGVYVLATDTVQRRTKEIALRKLFGTRRRDIGVLVAKEIGTVVFLSAIIALPLTGLIISRYLAGYTEIAPMAFWALALAPLTSIAVALLAGSRQTWVAMNTTPAVALRG